MRAWVSILRSTTALACSYSDGDKSSVSGSTSACRMINYVHLDLHWAYRSDSFSYADAAAAAFSQLRD